MANVLGELFQNIANAIRSKTDSTAKLKPIDFASAISSIKVGGTSTDAIDDILDAINGEVIGETQYTVTFIGADGSTLGTMQVYEQDDCPNPVSSGVFSKPTKESTKYYRYTFSGWGLTESGGVSSNALKNITADRTLYAKFSSTEIMLETGSLLSTDPYITSAVYWKINPDYVLTIYGDGRPYWNDETTLGSAPWYKYRSQITKVVIEDGVTNVNTYSFADCTNMTEVVLGNSITKIEYQAFIGCTSLTTVTLPSSLTIMGTGLFKNCTSLRSINIPSKVFSITGSPVVGCTALEGVTFAVSSGWTKGNGGETIPASNLSTPAIAAIYLTSTYTGSLYNAGVLESNKGGS